MSATHQLPAFPLVPLSKVVRTKHAPMAVPKPWEDRSAGVYTCLTISRSGRHLPAYRQVVRTEGGQIYARPIGPTRNPFLRDSTWESRCIHRLTEQARGDELAFFTRYYNLIACNLQWSKRPWTRGVAFAHCCKVVWSRVQHAAIRRYRSEGRTARVKPVRVSPNFEVLYLEDNLPPTDYSWEEEGPIEVPIPKSMPPTSEVYGPYFPPREEVLRARNVALLMRVQMRIYLLRLLRSSRLVQNMHHFHVEWLHDLPFSLSPTISIRRGLYACRKQYVLGHNQMGDVEDAHSTDKDAKVIEDTAGNVCLMDQRECSNATMPTVVIPPTMSMGEQHHEFANMIDRWIQLDVFEWTSAQSSNTELKKYSLPSSLLDNQPDSPNCAVFKNFMFCRPEIMHVKVLPNANKFQVGQLQVSWLYDTFADSNIEKRMHVSTLSQTMHSLVNAGSSNPGCLSIPFVNPSTYLPVVKRNKSDGELCLHLGTVYIRVLNALRASSATNNKCSVTVYIRFENCKFGGMKSRTLGDYVSPQMETASALLAVGAAERLLNRVIGDNNRDNPSYVSARAPMVPQAAQSFAAGTGSVEVTNTLRLDPRGLTSLFNTEDEMSVSRVCQVYGFIGTHTWTSSHLSGNLLFAYDASPCFDISEYSHVTVQSNICYYIPPVAVVSSLFAQWRGCLKMRLDFVKNQFYTGRIMVAYIPYVTTQPTYKQAQAGPHMVYDIAEKDSIEIDIPYITNRFAWPRRQGYVRNADNVDPPGRVWVFVVNPLVVMDSVPNSVEINIYWAGGDSFEVGIPAQPSIGSIFWTTDDNPDKEVRAYGGYWPWYWGYYGSFYEGKKAIARYGKGWQHVAQFMNLKETEYYTRNAKYVKNFPKLKKYDGTMFDPEYFVPLDLGDGLGFRYLGAVATQQDAAIYARAPLPKPTNLVLDIALDDDGPWSTGNPVFDGHEGNRIDASEASFEFVGKNQIGNVRDERAGMGPSMEECQLLPCPSTSEGKKIWGESFNSLKDLCRRYQPYGIWSQKITGVLGDAAFSFPVLPQGMNLQIEEMEKLKNYYTKYVREGTTPLITSGYRFYRGSIRFQLVVHPGKNLNFWVQHRPDYQSDTWKIRSFTGTADSAERYLNTGYAMALQTSRVNNVLSFEVPFYLPLYAVYLQRTNLDRPHAFRASSLGTVYVGIEGGDANATITAALFYALGDDAHCEVFQGFPPMLLLEGLPRTTQAIQSKRQLGENQGWKDWLPEIKIRHELPEELSAASIKSRLAEAIDNTKLDAAANWLADMTQNMGSEMKALVLDIISNLGHVLMNPTLKSIAWAITTILLKLGILTFNLLGVFTQILIDFLKWLGCRFAAAEPTETQGTVEMPATPDGRLIAENQIDDDTNIIIQLVSVAFTAVSQVTDCILEPPKNFKDYGKMLTRGLTKNCRAGTFLQQFLRNNLDLFTKISNIVTCKLNSNKMFEKLAEEELTPLIEWCEEVELLLDPKHDERTFALDSTWSERVEYAYIIGCKIQKFFVDYVSTNSKSRPAFGAFNSLYQRLIKKRTDMYKRGQGTIARREPYCIWFYGDAGCGKSTALQSLIPELLRSEGIQYVGEPTFTLQAGVQYWNGCKNQPAMLIDDFMNVQTGELCQQQLRDYWSVKSPTVLNPPFAALEDKEQRYAPEILCIGSNYIFPRIVQVDDTALWRRRELLVEVELIPAVRKSIKHMNQLSKVKQIVKELGLNLARYEHLRFRTYTNPADSHSSKSEWMSWVQFLVVARQGFKEYRQNQLALYERRMEEYRQSMQADLACDTTESLEDRKKMFKRLVKFLHAVEPKGGYPFKDFMSLAHQYARGEITKEAICKMSQVKANFLKARTKTTGENQAGEEQVIWKFKPEVAERSMEDLKPSHYTDIIKDILNINILEYKSADVYSHVAMLSFLAANFDPQALKATVVSKDHTNVVVSALGAIFHLKHKQYSVVCYTCTESLEKCFCANEWEKRSNYQPLGASVEKTTKSVAPSNSESSKPKELICPHDGFCADMAYFPACDPYPAFFECFNKKLKINAAVCEGTCVWKDTQRLVGHMDAWKKQNPEAFVTISELTVPQYWLDKYAKAKEATGGATVGIDKPATQDVVAGLKQADLLTPKSESWYERYAKGPLAKFWKFLKWAGPVLAFIGLFFGMYTMVYGVPARVAALYMTQTAETVGVLGAGAYVAGSVTQYQTLPGPSENQVGSSGDTAQAKNVARSAKPDVHAFATNQNGALNDHMRTVISFINKNTYFIYANGVAPIRVVIMYENYALMPWHYIVTWRKHGVKRCVIRRNDNPQFELDSDFESWVPIQPGNRDICLVKLLALPNHRSLLKWVATQEEHTRPKGMCTMVEPQALSPVCYLAPVTADMVNLQTTGDYVAALDNVYTYQFTGKGRCGSVLICASSNTPIIGMHIAGAEVYGFGEPLVREAFSSKPIVEPAEPVGVTTSDDVYKDKLPGTYLPYGLANDGMAHNQSGETQIVKSRCHGIFPVVTQPAPLRQGDPRVLEENYSPLWSGCANMTKPTKDFPDRLLLPAGDYMEQRLISICEPVVNRVSILTVADAVAGRPYSKYYDGIDLHTSEGFPLSRYRPSGANNKSWLFLMEGNPLQYKGMRKELVDLCVANMRHRYAGRIPQTIFDDCLKDARIPKEKCKIPGKTRIFSTSPIEYTIAVKQFFGDFQAAFKTHRLKLCHAIGINPDSMEWARLVTVLQQRGDHYITGDYSNFGPSLNTRVLWRVAKMILAWYEFYEDSEYVHEHNLVRYILFCETIHALHMTHDYVWQAYSGLPSGCPLTVELNSMVNELYIIMAWREIFKDHAYKQQFDVMQRSSKLITYGDDLIMSIKAEFTPEFNNLTLSEFFAEYGIKFTDASKKGNKPFEVSLSECTFLKRSFLPHPHFPTVMLAPLDEAVSVKDVANWARKCADPIAATVESILASNINAHSLGPQRFAPIHKVLKGALIRLNSDVVLRNWDDIDKLRFPEMYGIQVDAKI